jgi:hypothetical protein
VPAVLACRCRQYRIDGQPVDLCALALIFSILRERGCAPELAADELMASVEMYNAVPPELKAAYRSAILREYALYWLEGVR